MSVLCIQMSLSCHQIHWAVIQLINAGSILSYHIIILEHKELPAKLPDYFLWSNKSNINQVFVLSQIIMLRLGITQA